VRGSAWFLVYLVTLVAVAVAGLLISTGAVAVDWR
jgi:hypothetical protein